MANYLDENDAAKIMGCSPALLRKWRRLGQGPTYRHVGRLIRYFEPDIHAYMDAQRAETGGAR